MKKLLLLSFMMTFVLLLKSQPSYTISGGVKLINAEQRTTSLWYVDESPSRDNLSKSISQIGNLAYGLSARFQDDNMDKKFHLFIELQGYLGSISGLALNTGFFYKNNESESNVRIQPEMSLILGYCSKGIGQIENNDIYIQVNQTKFQDNTNVNVALQNIYYGIKPGLSFIFKTGSESEIGLGVNYQLSVKTGLVAFSGIGQDGNPANDSESLNEPNVGFYVDGNKSDKIPYNPDGLEFKVFYSF